LNKAGRVVKAPWMCIYYVCETLLYKEGHYFNANFRNIDSGLHIPVDIMQINMCHLLQAI